MIQKKTIVEKRNVKEKRLFWRGKGRKTDGIVEGFMISKDRDERKLKL